MTFFALVIAFFLSIEFLIISVEDGFLNFGILVLFGLLKDEKSSANPLKTER